MKQCSILVALLVATSGCTVGMKVSTNCEDGQTRCDSLCIDTDLDLDNCGSCGNSCGDGEICFEGACLVACSDGLSRCDGMCKDLEQDKNNCGTCGNACDEGSSCIDGACQIECPPDFTACEQTCINTATDSAHCGGCGNACPEGNLCSDGACVAACPEGQTACGESCVDLNSDAANCGECGQACEAPAHAFPACEESTCAFTCEEHFADCDNDASNGCETDLTTPENCGACGAQPQEVCDGNDNNCNGAFDEGCPADIVVRSLLDRTIVGGTQGGEALATCSTGQVLTGVRGAQIDSDGRVSQLAFACSSVALTSVLDANIIAYGVEVSAGDFLGSMGSGQVEGVPSVMCEANSVVTGIEVALDSTESFVTDVGVICSGLSIEDNQLVFGQPVSAGSLFSAAEETLLGTPLPAPRVGIGQVGRAGQSVFAIGLLQGEIRLVLQPGP